MENLDYQSILQEKVQMYSTRLVREKEFQIGYGQREQMGGPEDLFNFLCIYYQDKDREEFLSVMLDTANTVIGVAQISVGSLSSSIVEAKQVFKPAIVANAGSVILAHNHPSGNPEPSKEDINITRQLVEAGDQLDLPVNDHLIIAEYDWTSLAERGVI